MGNAVITVLAADVSDEVPFFVAAGVLVIWAVIVGGLGAAGRELAGGRVSSRAAMGVSVVLVAAAMVTAVWTASRPEPAKATAKPKQAFGAAPPATPKTSTTEAQAPAPKPATGPLKLAADKTQLAYDTKSLAAKAGEVKLDFSNPSSIEHNVTIADSSGKVLGHTATITSSSSKLSVKLKPGTYTFYCSVDAHRQAGMQGTLTVK